VDEAWFAVTNQMESVPKWHITAFFKPWLPRDSQYLIALAKYIRNQFGKELDVEILQESAFPIRKSAGLPDRRACKVKFPYEDLDAWFDSHAQLFGYEWKPHVTVKKTDLGMVRFLKTASRTLPFEFQIIVQYMIIWTEACDHKDVPLWAQSWDPDGELWSNVNKRRNSRKTRPPVESESKEKEDTPAEVPLKKVRGTTESRRRR
jgi:hypothetical protein